MKVLDKITKLLALADSPNEHEAALAMEKAHALLAEHNLTMANVAAHTTSTPLEEIGHDTATSKMGATWVRHLWYATAKLYFCEYFYSRGNHRTYHTVIGSQANSATAIHMAEYLTSAVVKLSNAAGTGTFRSNFRQGCAMRLNARMRDLKAQQENPATTSSSNLPAVYNQSEAAANDYMDEKFNIRKGKSRAVSISNGDGYSAGNKAAEGIGLHTQTTTTKRKELR